MLKFATADGDPLTDPCRHAPHVADPLIQETIALFGGSVLLETSLVNGDCTTCPPDPFHVAGVTPLLVSSADMEDICASDPAPLTRFVFTLTVSDLVDMAGELDAAAVMEAWFLVRRYAPVSGHPEATDGLRTLVRDARMLMFVNHEMRGLLRGGVDRAAEAEAIKRELPGLLDKIAYPEGTPSA